MCLDFDFEVVLFFIVSYKMEWQGDEWVGLFQSFNFIRRFRFYVILFCFIEIDGYINLFDRY